MKLFSVARDLAGFHELEVELEQKARASSVLDVLVQRNPHFKDWKPSLRIAVNQEYVHADHALRDGDEVAIIPPVSGG
ncbi:MAG: molybdopterin converting factor subunit 1 [Ignavibacteriales bacterium]|nr:molybdopterin converting factor subunit 1 [Ignavibacteriales bacterium]